MCALTVKKSPINLRFQSSYPTSRRKKKDNFDGYIAKEPSKYSSFYIKQEDTGAGIVKYAEELTVLAKVLNISQEISALEKKPEIYQTVDIVYSQVLEITEHFVLGSCMINEVERKVKRVRYNKDVLSELGLKEGDIIEVKVFTKPGEIKSTYTKNAKPDVAKKFEWERNEEDPFKDIDFSKLLRPLPSEK